MWYIKHIMELNNIIKRLVPCDGSSVVERLPAHRGLIPCRHTRSSFALHSSRQITSGWWSLKNPIATWKLLRMSCASPHAGRCSKKRPHSVTLWCHEGVQAIQISLAPSWVVSILSWWWVDLTWPLYLSPLYRKCGWSWDNLTSCYRPPSLCIASVKLWHNMIAERFKCPKPLIFLNLCLRIKMKRN